MNNKTITSFLRFWLAVFFSISFTLFANPGNASYLICIEADGSVEIEVEGIDKVCSSPLNEIPHSFRSDYNDCTDLPVSINNSNAIKQQNQPNENQHASTSASASHLIPAPATSHPRINYSTQKLHFTNLALISIKKTVLLN